ncbi:MAG: hypothetical protein RLZZ609_1908 [Cyanobacteriota bacterium]
MNSGLSLPEDAAGRATPGRLVPPFRRVCPCCRPLPLEPLLPLFHQLNREHFEGSLVRQDRPLVSLRWSDGRLTRTAGLYRRWRCAEGPIHCEILLSRPLLDPLPRTATLSTLCHEMIHAWVDRVLGVREVHGPHFRERMARINASQPGFEVSVRHRYPVPVQPARWLARCPCCGFSSPYRRRRQGLACRQCCERLHGGRWDATCLLVFEPLTP